MAQPTFLTEIARAKINLTLQVGPPATDGYHSLQSLVVFADIGDDLSAKFSQRSDNTSVEITGPFASALIDNESNIIFPALDIIQRTNSRGIEFTLTKNLPVASGIGGGSADAAAAIRMVCHQEKLRAEEFIASAAQLGADIPVCIESQTCLMFGKGEKLKKLPGRGQLHAVLINPGVEVGTGRVFKAYDETGCFSSDLSLPDTDVSLLEMALTGRNDLQPAAISIAPEISNVLSVLEIQADCQLARMSGSGATCYGLFPDKISAENAAKKITNAYPNWWCVPTVLGDKV